MFCCNPTSLLQKQNQSLLPTSLFLFLDASIQSFKVILINKHNLKVIPLAYCKGKKYNENGKYLWEICANFKVISILLGMQLGFVQYCCFVCQLRSRSKEQYETVNWPLRDEIKAGHQNIKRTFGTKR